MKTASVVRELRRHLPMSIRVRAPHPITLSEAAEHEAAHAVVALASGGDVAMIHVGPTFGGMATCSRNGFDGLTLGIGVMSGRGAFAVAGMVQTGADWLGAQDAVALLAWVRTLCGPYPSSCARERDGFIDGAKREASRILRRHRRAVRAIAGLIEERRTILDFDFRGMAKRASPSLPAPLPIATFAKKHWPRALAGKRHSVEIANLAGMGPVLELARKELALRG